MTEIARITSRQNRRLVYARRVRDGHEPSLLFIEGKRLAAEALGSELRMTECFFTPDLATSELVRAAAAKGAIMSEVSPAAMRSISAVDHSQGIALIAERSAGTVDSFAISGPIPLFIYLSEINNPSNLGAVVRSAEAAGASGIFISEGSADAFSPKSLRASMGSAFRMTITEGAALDDVIDHAEKEGITALALDITAKERYLDIDWTKPHLLIVGSEAHGLSEDQLQKVGRTISIPMNNPVESLNLSVAAGIVLFEAKRQNG
jgi:TrmH family RNA methyltransferase